MYGRDVGAIAPLCEASVHGDMYNLASMILGKTAVVVDFPAQSRTTRGRTCAWAVRQIDVHWLKIMYNALSTYLIGVGGAYAKPYRCRMRSAAAGSRTTLARQLAVRLCA